MYKMIINNYIKNLTLADINNLNTTHSIKLSSKEQQIIYNILKTNWQDLYNDNQTTWNIIKQEINSFSYNLLRNLYLEYKNKYDL